MVSLVSEQAGWSLGTDPFDEDPVSLLACSSWGRNDLACEWDGHRWRRCGSSREACGE